MGNNNSPSSAAAGAKAGAGTGAGTIIKLSEKKIKHIMDNTGLSREEIAEWNKQFLNEYPTGSIDFQAFTKIFKQFYPNGNPEKYARIAFRAFDTDKSGKITFDEFLIATSFTMHSDRPSDQTKALDFAFDIYDADNNGKIDKREMEKITIALYELEGRNPSEARERVQEVFKQYDIDQNGSLDKYEFFNFIINDPISSRVFRI